MSRFPFIFVVFLTWTSLSVALAAGDKAELSQEQKQFLDETERAVGGMSPEELKDAIKKLKEGNEQRTRDRIDAERAVRLAQLLLQIEKVGRVKITDCTKLTVKEKSPEALAILDAIKSYCQDSPQNIWAEITKTGQLKFTFVTGTTNGTKTVTIGGGSAITLGYRGKELKLGANITSTDVKTNATSSLLKYDNLLDYAIDLGIANLETFLKWQGTYESSSVPNAEVPATLNTSQIRRNVFDAGLRYKVVSSDPLKFKIGVGIGGSHLVQGGSLNTPETKLSPSLGITYDFNYTPIKGAELFIHGRLQRDVLTKDPRTVAILKSGAKATMGPLGFALEYVTDYDGARSVSKVSHLFSANIIASVDPRDWKSEKKKKEAKAAQEREERLWKKTLQNLKEIKKRAATGAK
jgi:hypothetical protein